MLLVVYVFESLIFPTHFEKLLISRVRIHLIFIKPSMLFFPVPSHAPDLLLFITLSAVHIYVPYKHSHV